MSFWKLVLPSIYSSTCRSFLFLCIHLFWFYIYCLSTDFNMRLYILKLIIIFNNLWSLNSQIEYLFIKLLIQTTLTWWTRIEFNSHIICSCCFLRPWNDLRIIHNHIFLIIWATSMWTWGNVHRLVKSIGEWSVEHRCGWI